MILVVQGKVLLRGALIIQSLLKVFCASNSKGLSESEGLVLEILFVFESNGDLIIVSLLSLWLFYLFLFLIQWSQDTLDSKVVFIAKDVTLVFSDRCMHLYLVAGFSPSLQHYQKIGLFSGHIKGYNDLVLIYFNCCGQSKLFYLFLFIIFSFPFFCFLEFLDKGVCSY